MSKTQTRDWVVLAVHRSPAGGGAVVPVQDFDGGPKRFTETEAALEAFRLNLNPFSTSVTYRAEQA